jgi:hypothetical protein
LKAAIRERSNKKLDWLGAPPVTFVFGGVVFALIEPSRGAIAGATGIVALIAFVFVEQRARTPILPFDLFRSRDFTRANLLTLFLYTGLA